MSETTEDTAKKTGIPEVEGPLDEVAAADGEAAAVTEDAPSAQDKPAEAPAQTAAQQAAQRRRSRQWVTLRNASMDTRIGRDIMGNVAGDLRSAVGKPHDAAIAAPAGVPEALIEDLRRDLVDKGFLVRTVEVPSGEGACTLPGVECVCEQLAEADVTGDDLVIALGDADALSVVSYACSTWCDGVSLAEVPLDLVSCITAGPTPRALDLPGHPRMITQNGSARFAIFDLALFDCDPTSENVLHAFALMVSTAMCDNDKAFGRLWDRADDLVAGDSQALEDQLLDTVKGRGKIVSSTSAATRQSMEYGQTFSAALRPLVGPDVPESAIFAEALRFAARLSAGQGLLSIDDMFTQDELLERLGVGSVECEVDPDALLAGLREQRFARTNRFMLGIPRSLGRVRLSALDDELIEEHVRAWCDARTATE